MTIVSLVTLIVLAVLVLLGLSSRALKDFRMGSIAAFILLALVVLLNFIPTVTIAGIVSFRVGVILFYGYCFYAFLFKGKPSNRGIAFLISIILAGIIYGGIALANLFGNAFFGDLNFVYAIFAGLAALAFTKNAKYAFISSAIAIMLVSVVLQIGTTVNLNAGFEWAALAAGIGVVSYGMLASVQTKPGRMSYYFEMGRLED
ncbi:MAG: hypothetical protein ACOYIQ_00155 [Christensenellales bacterium]|jgi:hypothetical protein